MGVTEFFKAFGDCGFDITHDHELVSLCMSDNLLNTLSIKQLKRAVDIKAKIARLEGELASLLGTPAPAAAKGPRRRRRMSAAGRARIAAAAKARWARHRAEKKKA